MDFAFFSQRLSKIKNLPLPGEASHFKMMPRFRLEELKAATNDKRQPKQAAVMALFYPDENKITHLLLILRKTYKGVHSNQIGFPGGKAEDVDDSLMTTALRETEEEVGVAIAQIEVLKALSMVYIPPSNFEVWPFLGICKNKPNFSIQEEEVEALVQVSLTDFMNDANLFMQKMSTSYAENIEVPAYRLNGHIVWGATAMMLSEVRTLLGQLL